MGGVTGAEGAWSGSRGERGPRGAGTVVVLGGGGPRTGARRVRPVRRLDGPLVGRPPAPWAGR
ncbi:hypothetical protein SLI_6574 [Streptomyces lividans 1326]|uniref:Uncharacterized protein n=1 Tax=Streptomyces lividans 1326 TaxID=1200984 RepID=A0A7U9HE84_STRLI|nr:hypothetical protein SLI_6574 [Streptomyces lividans 1326]